MSQKDTAMLESEVRKYAALEKEGKLDKALKKKKQQAEETLQQASNARLKLGLSSKPELNKPKVKGKTILGGNGSEDEKSDEDGNEEDETQSDSDTDDSSDGTTDESEEEDDKPAAKPVIDFKLIKLPQSEAPPIETHVIYASLDLPEIKNPNLLKPTQPQRQPQQPSFATQMYPVPPPHWIPPPNQFPFPPNFRPPMQMVPPPGMPFNQPPPFFITQHAQISAFNSPSIPNYSAAPQQHPPQQKLLAKPSVSVITADPQLRDLQKELVAFVPAALRRNKPGAVTANDGNKKIVPAKVPKLNAAPDVGDEEEKNIKLVETTGVKKNVDKPANTNSIKKMGAHDEYDAFMKEIEGLL
ncbi:hypothetical protein HK098_004121 [Nowakowskiella sp. JEL0407]|nr:hypothetical protein HK098_004121 [Nowakowskiella sp. JEL0407]